MSGHTVSSGGRIVVWTQERIALVLKGIEGNFCLIFIDIIVIIFISLAVQRCFTAFQSFCFA